jgi:hypothetical protein
MRPFCPNAGQGSTCTTINFGNVAGTLVRSQYVGSGGSRAGLPGSTRLLLGGHGHRRWPRTTPPTARSATSPPASRASPPGATASHRRVLDRRWRGGRRQLAWTLALEDIEALGRLTTGQVTGSVSVPGGIPSDPHRRPAVILATPPATGNAMDPATWRPVNLVRVAADGTFTARVPSRRHLLRGPHGWAGSPIRGTGAAVTAGGQRQPGYPEPRRRDRS